jgi:hypothetical protein
MVRQTALHPEAGGRSRTRPRASVAPGAHSHSAGAPQPSPRSATRSSARAAGGGFAPWGWKTLAVSRAQLGGQRLRGLGPSPGSASGSPGWEEARTRLEYSP